MNSNNNDQSEKITIGKLNKEEQKLVVCTDKELLDYYDYTVKWLQTQVKNAGAGGVVLGISGGVDSALVSKIAADAFPGRSIGVSINLNSFPNFQKHSREVILFTGIKHISLSISDIYSSLWQKIDSVTTLKSNELAKANVKPRMRMTVLYYIASKYKYLVVGTDNADEIYLGYFTKYGDGGVDLLPIAKLNKAQVRRLTKLKGFPESVYNQVASADLWINQTDEDEMKVKYNDVDLFLNGHEKDIEPYSVSRIKELHDSSEHKRKLPPTPSKSPIKTKKNNSK